MGRYYIQQKSGEVFGPFEKPFIERLIIEGNLSGEERISTDRTSWRSVLSVEEFSRLFEARGTRPAETSVGTYDSTPTPIIDPKDQTVPYPSTSEIDGIFEEEAPEGVQGFDIMGEFEEEESSRVVFPPPVDHDQPSAGDSDVTKWARPKPEDMLDSQPGYDTGPLTDVTMPTFADITGVPPIGLDRADNEGKQSSAALAQEISSGRPPSAFEELMDVLDRKSGLMQIPTKGAPAETPSAGTFPTSVRQPGTSPEQQDVGGFPLAKPSEGDLAPPQGVRVVLPLPVESVPELPIPKRYEGADSDLGEDAWAERHYRFASDDDREARSSGTQPGETDEHRGQMGPMSGPKMIEPSPPSKIASSGRPDARSPMPAPLPGGPEAQRRVADKIPELPVPIKDEMEESWSVADTVPELPALRPLPPFYRSDDDSMPGLPPLSLGKPGMTAQAAGPVELPAVKDDDRSDLPVAREQAAELPAPRIEEAELPTKKESLPELPTLRIGGADLPTSRDGVAELPTRQIQGTVLPGRREGKVELPTSRFGGTGLPSSTDRISGIPGVTASRFELPISRLADAGLPEGSPGTVVTHEGEEVTPTIPLDREDIERMATSGVARDSAPVVPSSDFDLRVDNLDFLEGSRPVSLSPAPPSDRLVSAEDLKLSFPEPYSSTAGARADLGPSSADIGGEPLRPEEIETVSLAVSEAQPIQDVAEIRRIERPIAVEKREGEAPPRRMPKAKPGKSRLVPYIAILGVLGLILLGVVLFTDLFQGDQGAGSRQMFPGPNRAQEVQPQVVTRAPVVDFDLLMPGTFGDYVSFLQQAAAAANDADNTDLNAVARLVVGQSLMAIQYHDNASLVGDMARRAGFLTESSEELHRLARGAWAATQGDVAGAEQNLVGIESGPNAAWACLFRGLAEIERYRQAVETYHPQVVMGGEGGGASREPADAIEEPAGSEAEEARPDLAVEADSGQAEPSPPSADTVEPVQAAPPVEPPPPLDSRVEEYLQMALRLAPDLTPAYYFLGLTATLQEDLDSAKEHYRAALERRPQHLPSVIALSDVLFRQGEFDEARRRLVLALDLPSDRSSERERSMIHNLLGQIAMARRQFEEAIDQLQQAFNVDPSHIQVVPLLSELFSQTGQYQQAVDFLNQHAASGASNAEIILALAQNRLGLGDAQNDSEMLNQLLADLERGQETFPSDPRFPYYLGRVSQVLNQFDQAETYYRASIQRDANFRLGYLALAELARQSNDQESALTYLADAVSRGEAEARIEKQIGDAYQLMGLTDFARQSYVRAVELNPYYIDARLQLADLMLLDEDEEQYAQVLDHLRRVEEIGVDLPRLHALFARVQYRLGSLNQARARMQRVAEDATIRSEPEHLYLFGRIHFDIGELAQVSGDTQGAQHYFELARDNFAVAYTIQRDMSEAKFWEGRAYLALGQVDSAIPAFRNAFEMSVRDGTPSGKYRFWLGVCQELAGQYQNALESYLMVDRYDLRWALGHPEFYYHRGRLLAGLEHLRRARRDLEWALILKPDYVEATLALAEVFFQQQQYPQAVTQWNRSLEIDAAQPAVHYRLGTTHIRMEDIENATLHLERARSMGYAQEQPEVYRTLGFLYRDWPAGRRTQEAIESFRQYLESGAVDGFPDLRIEIENQIRQLGGAL